MAKTLARTYVFTPGAANVGTIVIPGRIQLEQLLVITNTTKNVIIYNFADATYAGTTVTFTIGNNASFPTITQRVDGYTTITLAYSTVGMTGDKIQVLYEETENGVKIRVFWLPRKLAPNSLVFDKEQMLKWYDEGFATANDPTRIEIFE